MKKTVFILVLRVFLLTACQSAPEPMAVVNSWQDALNKGDVDLALSHMAEDGSVTIIPPEPGDDGVYEGSEEIRARFEAGSAAHGITTLSDCRVDGENVTCLDTYVDDGLKALGLEELEGAWEAVVRQGKIQSYTFTTTDESLAVLMAAIAAAQAPPTPEPPTATPEPPTATPEPPTAVPPTAAADPATGLTPEMPVASIEDVLGEWAMTYEGEDYILIFEPDGVYTVGWEGNLTGVARGYYSIEGNALYFLTHTNDCPPGHYDVFVVKQDGRPAQLRFVGVDRDTCQTRRESVNNKTLLPVAP